MGNRTALPELIVDTLRVPLLLLDADLRVLLSNREYSRAFKASSAAPVGSVFSKIGSGQWDIKGLHARLKLVVLKDEAFKNFEVDVLLPKIGRRTMLISALRLRGGKLTPERRILLTFDDVTQQRNREAMSRKHADELVRSNHDLERFAYVAAHELLAPMRKAVEHAESITSRYKWKVASTDTAGSRESDIDIDIDIDNLTLREREILILIADGAINKEIAQKLMIGVRTVETHRQSLMMKLGIRTVAGLTKFAVAGGLTKLK